MSLDADIKSLSKIPVLSELESDALRLLAFSAETQVLRAGDILFQRGDVSDGGYVVMAGSIALDETGSGGPAQKIVRPVALIGEVALITQTQRPVMAIAREPSTVLRIPRNLFHRVLKEYPVSAARLHSRFENRLGTFVRELRESPFMAD